MNNPLNHPNMAMPNFPNMNQNIFNSTLSLKDFEIIEKISQGYFAPIFKVKYKLNGQIYAIKQYEKAKIKSDLELDLYREKAILYDLTQRGYPTIVKLYADFEDSTSINLVMEYVEGINLRKLITDNKGGYLSQDLIINILTQLLETLQFLHDKCHIINRNIKPDNIMIQKNNQIKLINFGISAYLENSNNKLVSRKSIKGEVHFVPPEIIFRGTRPDYDYKMDIFSLGFTMYSLMNPSNTGEINLPQITKREKGSFFRTEQHLVNNYYQPMLIEFVKLLYENNPTKRPTASGALELLKKILPNNNSIPTANQFISSAPQINNNDLNTNTLIAISAASQQNNALGTIYMNPDSNNENRVLSSMKSLLQILYHLDIMNFIRNQLISLLSNNQINNNQFFMYSFMEMMNLTQQFNSGNINQANYNQKINEFIQKVFNFNNFGITGNRPIILFFIISSIIKEEISKYFNFYQNNIFDNMIQNNFMDLNNFIPMTNQIVYNSISQNIFNFKNTFRGPLVDNFYFILVSVSNCPNCKNLIGINTQVNQFLHLDVKNPQNKITDLINDYFCPKIGFGNYQCNNCGLQGKKTKITYCLNLPNYLIIELDDKNSVNFNDNIYLTLFNGVMCSYQYLSGIYKLKKNNITDFVAVIKNGNNFLFYSDDKIEPCPQNFVNLECPSLVIYKRMS